VVVKYLPNGQFDSSFGDSVEHSGYSVVDLDGNHRSAAADITFDRSNTILLAGTGLNSHFLGTDERDMVVGRLNSNGTLDESFGDDGHRFIGGNGGATASSMALDP